MDDDEIKLILVGLILLVGLGLPLTGVLIWFIKNVVTPIGTIENIAWALDSPNPWDWVWRLMLLGIGGLVFATVIAWFREQIG